MQYKGFYYIREQSLFMAGVSQKRKGLGKWKTKQHKGCIIKLHCHFQSVTHSNIEASKKKCQQSYVNTKYVNQSESLSWSFSDLSGSKWCLQRKYMCRQHETLDCRKFHKQLSNSCHRSSKGHVWQLNTVSFCKGFGQGWVFIFQFVIEIG
jgi:hypothetical protein